MRIPLASNLESRDGTLDQDALVKNGVVEKSGDSLTLRKRPGLSQYAASATAGAGQALAATGTSLVAIIGDKLTWLTSRTDNYLDPENKGSNGTLSNSNLSVSFSGVGGVSAEYDFDAGGLAYAEVTLTNSGSQRIGLAYSAAPLTSVCPGSQKPDGNTGTYSVTSITRSGTTATVTTSGNHNFANPSDIVTVAGAGQSEYNLSGATTTYINATQFSYQVSGSPATPATGTIVCTESNGTAGNVHVVYDASDGKIYLSSNSVAWADTGVTATSGDIIGVAVYMDLGTTNAYIQAKFYKNGSLIYTLSADNSPSTYIASTVQTPSTCTLILGANTSGGAMTVNFGASAFTYAVPSQLECAISPTNASQRKFWTAETGPSASTGYLLMHNGLQALYAATKVYPQFGGAAFVSLASSIPGPLAAGIAYLDGYFFVMDVNGKINNSGSENVTFGALDYLYASAYQGNGVYIGRTLQYIVALKEWSTEWFYDAGNATGSVLASVSGSARAVGCADGYSACNVADSIFFISQETGGKRGITRVRGVDLAKVSTEEVDKVLDLSNLSDTTAYGTTAAGKGLYVITLGDLGVTLVYDESADHWAQWSTLTIGASVSVTSITRSGTTATVTTGSAHGISDGDPVTISGANQADYNGIFQAAYVSSTVFTIEVSNSPTTPATGTILAYPFTEGEFSAVAAVTLGDAHLVLGGTNSEVYELTPSVCRDDVTAPINFFARTTRLDGGTTDQKKLSRIGVIGDKVSDTAMIRWSDDDSTNFTKYRRVTLSNATPELRRCGAFERRSIEFRHIGNTAPSIDALELDIWR